MIGQHVFEYLYQRFEGRSYSDFLLISCLGTVFLITFYLLLFLMIQWLIPNDVRGLGIFVGSIIIGSAAFDIIFWGSMDILKHDWEVPEVIDYRFFAEPLGTIALTIILSLCAVGALVGLFLFATYLGYVLA